MGGNISGVILAGGSNRRFNGITKANIVINGKTIISRIIGTIEDLFDEIIIVTNLPEMFTEFSKFKITGDHFLNSGPLGGIHAALRASSGEAVFVFAGDMPLLDKELIISQIKFYEKSKCDLLTPRINQNIEPLHSIYNTNITNILEEYLQGSGDLAVREFFKLLHVNYFQLESSENNTNAFINVNSPADISIVEKIMGIY
jgi:molybdopterin-guanine dinucleotide biosynthesis protein A